MTPLSTQQLEELLSLEKKASTGEWESHALLTFKARESIRSIVEELLAAREVIKAAKYQVEEYRPETSMDLIEALEAYAALTQPQEKQ